MKISVIPDIHGELDALKALGKAIGASGKGHLVVQLGDFIDRGPASKGCVEWLMKRQAQDPEHFVVLKGNHEDLMEKAEDSHSARSMWLLNGGDNTLKSYDGDFERLCLGNGSHGAWMATRPLSYQTLGVLFCHAGLGAKNQDAKDAQGLLWDRPPLKKGNFRAVVCGHTPTASGEIEHKDGIFRCDIGIGRKKVTEIQYLELELSESNLEWKIKKI